MSDSNSALWRDMMAYLRQQHAPICRQWFNELEAVDLSAGLLTIHTNNRVQKNYLEKQCLESFTEAAQSATGALIGVRFIDGDDAAAVARRSPPAPPAPAPAPAPLHPTPDVPTPEAPPLQAPITTPRPAPRSLVKARRTDDGMILDQTVISPDYSFENFVQGPENALAYSAAVAVSNQPGTAYNPLFIHGGVGLGKTHLLQAICQSVLETDENSEICYLSCDAFVNQFLDCVQQGQMAQFRHRHRHVDVLVIDDIHFLANRERTQEEFFNTFNELYQLNRQIVLSSDSPPSEIPQLEERLVSRFQCGLVAPVSRLKYETRVAIVRAKSTLRGIELPDDVVSYLATKIDSNARELEGAIITLQGHAALHHNQIDLTLAQSVFGDQVSASSPAEVTLQQVITAVTEFYNVRLSDLQSKRRHKSITAPRHACMWLARRHTRFSLEEIGGYFGGRDHTTVMHAIRIVDQHAAEDPTFAKQLEQIEAGILDQDSPGR